MSVEINLQSTCPVKIDSRKEVENSSETSILQHYKLHSRDKTITEFQKLFLVKGDLEL